MNVSHHLEGVDHKKASQKYHLHELTDEKEFAEAPQFAATLIPVTSFLGSEDAKIISAFFI